jgi:hypothetical protein
MSDLSQIPTLSRLLSLHGKAFQKELIRIKSFCVAKPTQRLSWTEPRELLFGVLMMDSSVFPANKDGMGHTCALI